ncbi:MAG: NYN domain-containing protein [Anaerolineaceae bacterium]|nr:NYN domain-containing protein [Anaerolineaceae bacterium]
MEDSNTVKNKTNRIAMLIDGDNAQPSLIKYMLAETGKYGLVTIRRIYGDWTTSNMSGWKEALQTYAFQPIQQFRYTVGKNATDSAMIIDTMDILYEGVVNSFCLVSSDSDYTRLATRIREKGFFVMGLGKKMTPRSFVNACEVFVFAENLMPVPREKTKRSTSKKTTPPDVSTKEAVPLLLNAYDLAVQDDDWAFLGTIGNHMRQLDPSFDARTYGHRQLSTLIRAFPDIFQVREIRKKDGTSIISVKLKD